MMQVGTDDNNYSWLRSQPTNPVRFDHDDYNDYNDCDHDENYHDDDNLDHDDNDHD